VLPLTRVKGERKRDVKTPRFSSLVTPAAPFLVTLLVYVPLMLLLACLSFCTLYFFALLWTKRLN
jgi:ABC-type multidrug transport system permease subunit